MLINQLKTKLLAILLVIATLLSSITFMPIKANAYSNSKSIVDLSDYNKMLKVDTSTMTFYYVISIKDEDINISTPYNTAVLYGIELKKNSNNGLTIPATVKYKDNNGEQYICRVTAIAGGIKNSKTNYKLQGKLDFSKAIYCTKVDSYAFALSSLKAKTGFLITSLNLGNVTKIGQLAFAGNSHLTSVTMNKVTTLYDGAFYECSRLKTIYMPKVTFIDRQVFSGCTNLRIVTFASNTKISKIGQKAFYECNSLYLIRLKNANGTYTNNKLPKVNTIDEYAIMGSFKSISLNTSKVNAYAFSYCRNLTKVTNSNKKCKYDANAFAYTPYGTKNKRK